MGRKEEEEYGEILPEGEAAYEELTGEEPIEDREEKDLSAEDIGQLVEEFQQWEKSEANQDKPEEPEKKEPEKKAPGRMRWLLLAAGLLLVIGVVGVLYGFVFRGNGKPDASSGEHFGQNGGAQKPEITTALDLSLPTASSQESQEPEEGTDSSEETAPEKTTAQEDTESYQEERFLDSEKYPEITQLIETYYTAYQSCDLDALRLLVDSNGGFSITADMLEERAGIVEYYDGIECSILEGPEEGTYVVYAFYRIKFYSIDTLAPALTRFYIVENESGEPHIYNGETSAEVTRYLDSLKENRAVIFLTNQVNSMLDQVCKKDEKLGQLMHLLSE